MGNLISKIYNFVSLKLSQDIWFRFGISKLNGHYSFSVTCVFVHQNYEKKEWWSVIPPIYKILKKLKKHTHKNKTN